MDRFLEKKRLLIYLLTTLAKVSDLYTYFLYLLGDTASIQVIDS